MTWSASPGVKQPMSAKLRAAVSKVLKSTFTRAALGTSELSPYVVANPKAELPRAVIKGAGGAASQSFKNSAKVSNTFYRFTVGDAVFFVHHQVSQPDKRTFDAGGASLDVFSADGNIVANGDGEGTRAVKWNVHFFGA